MIRNMLHNKVNEILLLDTERFNDFLGSKRPNFAFNNGLET